jgi:2-polyprenyl-3-methyl-5-hydroxy-6-metoxy-1,4-benzoquinol methylase
MSEFLRSDDVAAFFDRAGAATAELGQSVGYLSDGWPAALAENRFAGERSDFLASLDRFSAQRGAVLDVGCGTGQWLSLLASEFEQAVGIDLAEEMVVAAARRLEAEGLRARLVHAGIEDFAQATDQKFDLVFLGGVLMYVNDADLGRTLRALRSLLKPGGMLVARETTYRKKTYYRDSPLQPGLLSAPGQGERDSYRAIYREKRILRDAIAAEGFVVEAMRYNRHYRVVDTSKTHLRAINSLLRGGLQRDPQRAEKWARRVHLARGLTMTPFHLVCRALRLPAWNMDSHWYYCRPDGE